MWPPAWPPCDCKLFHSLFGWDYMAAVIIGAIVIISYTSVGGFSAVATMDLIQSIIMTIALCIIVVFGVVQVGGMDAVLEHARSLPGYLSFTETFNAGTNAAQPYGLIRIVSMMAWGLGYFGMPHILVRFMAIRHEDELKLSCRIAAIWVVISMGVAVFIGIVGHAVSAAGRIPFLEGSATETVIVRLSDSSFYLWHFPGYRGRMHPGRYRWRPPCPPLTASFWLPPPPFRRTSCRTCLGSG